MQIARDDEGTLGIVGRSALIQRARDQLRRAALTDLPVYLVGASGTGKELAARAIHSSSARRSEPYVAFNCSNGPESLVDSDLFGHERGAFTGADQARAGLFGAAGAGTLVLDEVAELPKSSQAKLLRVLEERSFRRVGSTKETRLAARIICATNVDLGGLVAAGGFRADLLYRLEVLPISLPALADRPEDIPDLLDHFSRHFARPVQFTPGAIDVLQSAPWPGNVRELLTLIDRLAVFEDASVIDADIVRRWMRHPDASRMGPLKALARSVLRTPITHKLEVMELVLVNEALEVTGGDKTAAGKLIGVDRRVIERCARCASATASAPDAHTAEGPRPRRRRRRP